LIEDNALITHAWFYIKVNNQDKAQYH
jgi:hypothetical protein